MSRNMYVMKADTVSCRPGAIIFEQPARSLYLVLKRYGIQATPCNTYRKPLGYNLGLKISWFTYDTVFGFLADQMNETG